MMIDLHIHSKCCSDGAMTVEEIFAEALKRGLDALSLTDHDSIDCQEKAARLAREQGLLYVTGLEINVSFAHPEYRDGKPAPVDFLAYGFDYKNPELLEKLHKLRDHRKYRAERILENINRELRREGRSPLDDRDMEAIEAGVDGAFGRPHIADYMVKKGLVINRQEAFDGYLVKCDEPKMPVSLEEASSLVRGAGGKIVLAHANDPNGTSLVSFTTSLSEQHEIIKDRMLPHIDGLECWHSRHDKATTEAYVSFAGSEGLIMTGGSDCHQRPVLMGTLDIPDHVLEPFGLRPQG